MNINRLTIKSQEALADAQQLAADKGNQEISSLHLLQTMLNQEGSFIASLLQKLEVDASALRNRVEQELEKLPKVSGAVQSTLSAELNKVLSQAEKEAQNLGDEYVSLEHLLLAMVQKAKLPFDLQKLGLEKDKL